MRDYDPTLGRYLQADPLGLVDGASAYGYALQNPGRYTDPRGEQSRSNPFGIPIPLVFIPGTPESISGGQAIVDLFNPVPLFEFILEQCTPDDEPGPNSDGTYTILTPFGLEKTNSLSRPPPPGPPKGPKKPLSVLILELLSNYSDDG